MQSLVVPADLRARLVDIARSALPNEACGLLGGSNVSGVARVDAVIAVHNSLRSPTAFALDGQAMIDAEERIDASESSVLGVFHSHPASAPVPSRRDVEDASLYDPHGDFVHVIVSMQGFVPTIRAFRYDEAEAHEIPIESPSS